VKRTVLKLVSLLSLGIFPVALAAVASEATASPLLPVVYQEVTAQKRQAAADYLLQGNRKLQERDFDGAIADYDQAISLSPSYYYLGVTDDIRRDFEGALKAFTQAAEGTPTGKPRDYIESRCGCSAPA
jgi:tetratricopeptide (TPR) repeat protein